MQILVDFARGAFNTLKVTSVSMLYRHPYRTSAEGLRSDWSNIGKDIDSVIGKLKSNSDE
jgi:hypothetical protein